MLWVEQRADPDATASDVLVLSYDDRKRSRLRARTQSGREVAIALSRGSALHDGDLLVAQDGGVLLVRAAPERVSEVQTQNAHLLARAAYHLGNRHVPLQIGPGFLRYLYDHVLDDMVRGLGLEVGVKRAVFEPEGGAYGGHGVHAHAEADARDSAGRESDHVHDHVHVHDPAHEHADDHGSEGRRDSSQHLARDLVPRRGSHHHGREPHE
jgi:urease accessory protein